MSIRTTVTLDEDVMMGLREESVQSGVPFKKVVNDMIRTGLASRSKTPDPAEFEIKSFAMGPPKFPIDDTSALLDYLEGEDRRW